MGTIQPRPRGGASLRGELRAARDDRQQIRRLLSTPPKAAPAAPAAAGGGIVGMAEVKSSGGVLFRAGLNGMAYAGVTYGAPTDPNAGNGGQSTAAVSSWLTVDGYQLRVQAGWYIPVLYMRVIWDDPNSAPPAFGGPYTYGGWNAVHNDYGVHARVPYGVGSGGFVQIGNYGPTFIPADGDLHAELVAVGGNPTADSNPAVSSIVWNITKLG